MRLNGFLNLIFLSSTLSINPAFVHATDVHSPRTAALGGAGHGAPLLNDAIFMNPASIGFMPAYNMYFGYQGHKGFNDSEPKGRIFTASILDGKNPYLVAGLAYTQKANANLLNLGLAKKVHEKISAGLMGKYYFRASPLPNTYNLGVSGDYKILDWLRGTLIIENLLDSNESMSWRHYRDFIFGFRLNYEKLVFLYLDPHYLENVPSGDRFGYQVGAEIPLAEDFFLRAGINKNALQPVLGVYGDGFGFGAGWVGPKLSLDFAIERTSTPEDVVGTHLSMTIYY